MLFIHTHLRIHVSCRGMCFLHSGERVREKIGKGRSGLWAISRRSLKKKFSAYISTAGIYVRMRFMIWFECFHFTTVLFLPRFSPDVMVRLPVDKTENPLMSPPNYIPVPFRAEWADFWAVMPTTLPFRHYAECSRISPDCTCPRRFPD